MGKLVINIIVEAKLIISVKEIRSLNETAFQTLKQIFTYKNPKFIDNEKWGYSNYGVPKHLTSYELESGRMLISRGGQDKVEKQLNKFDISVQWVDRTLVCESVDFEQSNVILREDQDHALFVMSDFDNGCLQAYASFGKTLSALELIRRIRQPAIIIVHTTFLQEQWIKEASDPKLFNLPKSEIGGVGGLFGGKKRRYRKLNICLYHSLMNPEHLNFFKDRVGLVWFDEGQKTPIEGVQQVVNHFRARYRYSGSANFKRKDGKQFLTFDAFGPVRHVVPEKNSASKILAKVNLIPSPYEDHDYDGSNYTAMITAMSKDRARNILICKRGIKKVRQGKLVLIFVERKEQAGVLAKMLSNFRVDMLLGGVNTAEVKRDKKMSPAVKKILLEYDDKGAYARIERLADKKKLDFVIGSQKSEVGLSIRTIDHGIVTTPMGNNDERFQQAKGRPERTYSESQENYFGHKKAIPEIDVIVDYKMPVSKRAADKIKEKYGNAVRTIKRKTKKNTVLRKGREE